MMGHPKYEVYFDWEEMKWKHIQVIDVQRWEGLFPDVDVVKEITKEMTIWLEKNKGRKTSHKKNWTKFILNWLKRSEEKYCGHR
jgi:hypothetical protein